MNRIERLVIDVCELAKTAGSRIRELRAEDMEAVQKQDRSLATRADREADHLLKEGLLSLWPAAWLSEETADNLDRLDARQLWIVDPLDGTKEFIAGIPEYAVAIALAERGEPVLAVVYNPMTEELFWAAKGGGAFRNGHALHVREGRTLLASRSEIAAGEFASFGADWETRAVGSIAYKLARIGSGDGALTFSRGPKHEWDVCAGSLIVAEAGGRVSDMFGGPLRYNQQPCKVKGIVAGAPLAFERALRHLEQVGPSDRMKELTAPTGVAGEAPASRSVTAD